MSNPVYQSYTSSGAKTPVIVDWTIPEFHVTVGALATFGSGVGTYNIEYTLDDVNDTARTARWIVDAGASGIVSADKVLSYSFPIQAVRLNITAYTSGTFEFKVLQGFKGTY